MNVSWIAPVKLCNQCFTDQGLMAFVSPQQQIGAIITIPPAATPEQASAVGNFVNSDPPPASCPHIIVDLARGAASDKWAQLNAILAAIPVGSDYDAIRARYTTLVANARAAADAFGPLV